MYKITKTSGLESFVTDEYLDSVVESGDTVEKYQPLTTRPTPTPEELQQMEDTQYVRDREPRYNQLNQDEMRYDDLVNGTTTWQDAIAAIKQEFPK